MKKLLVLFAFFLCQFPFQLQAQGFDAGIIADYHQLPYRSMTSYGLSVYVPFDKITINYQFSVGTSSTKGFYIHSPAGMAAGIYLASRIKPDSVPQFGRTILGIIGLLSLGIPEGVGIYLSQNEKISTHLIVNPLGFEYWKRKNPFVEEWRISGSLLFRVRATGFSTKFLYVAPQAGITWMYADGQIGFKGGIAIGFHSEGE